MGSRVKLDEVFDQNFLLVKNADMGVAWNISLIPANLFQLKKKSQNIKIFCLIQVLVFAFWFTKNFKKWWIWVDPQKAGLWGRVGGGEWPATWTVSYLHSSSMESFFRGYGFSPAHARATGSLLQDWGVGHTAFHLPLRSLSKHVTHLTLKTQAHRLSQPLQKSLLSLNPSSSLLGVMSPVGRGMFENVPFP